MADAVDEMLVKISSLVGGNPNWHTGEPLTISFKKVSAAETVRALWDKVSTTSTWLCPMKTTLWDKVSTMSIWFPPMQTALWDKVSATSIWLPPMQTVLWDEVSTISIWLCPMHIVL